VLIHLMSCVVYRFFYDEYDANSFRLTVDIAKEGAVEGFVKRSLSRILQDYLAGVKGFGFKLDGRTLLTTTELFSTVFGTGPTYSWEKDTKGQNRVFVKIRVNSSQLNLLRKKGITSSGPFFSLITSFLPDKDASILYQGKTYTNKSKLVPSFRVNPGQRVKVYPWMFSASGGFKELPSSFLSTGDNTVEGKLPPGAVCSGFEFSAEVRAFSPLLTYHYLSGPFVPLDTAICRLMSRTESQPMAVFACEPYLDGGSLSAARAARLESCGFSLSFDKPSPIQSFDRVLVFSESKTDIGANVCACETADISNTTGNEDPEVRREASRCFVSACNDPVSREEYGLLPEKCQGHCELVGTWVRSLSDLFLKGKRLLGFDTVRYRNICKTTLSPGKYPSFNWEAAGAAIVVCVLAVGVAALFPKEWKSRVISSGMSLVVGMGLVVLTGFLCAGRPACEDGKPTCRSIALDTRLPLDLCPALFPCECTSDQACGNGNECTEIGLCVGKLSGRRDVVEVPRPFHLRTVAIMLSIPCMALSVAAGWGVAERFLYRPFKYKVFVLALLFLAGTVVLLAGWIHFTSKPKQSYATIPFKAPVISFTHDKTILSIPTEGALCASLEDAKEAVKASQGKVSSVGNGWTVVNPEGYKYAVFSLEDRSVLIVVYPPSSKSGDDVRTMISTGSSFTVSSVQCIPS
jgi:hypothetical protein